MSDWARRHLLGQLTGIMTTKIGLDGTFGINLGMGELEDIIFFEKLRFYCRKLTAVLWLMSFVWLLKYFEIWRIMI